MKWELVRLINYDNSINLLWSYFPKLSSVMPSGEMVAPVNTTFKPCVDDYKIITTWNQNQSGRDHEGRLSNLASNVISVKCLSPAVTICNYTQHDSMWGKKKSLNTTNNDNSVLIKSLDFKLFPNMSWVIEVIITFLILGEIKFWFYCFTQSMKSLKTTIRSHKLK